MEKDNRLEIAASKYIVTKDGQVFNRKSGREVRLSLNSKGYKTLALYFKPSGAKKHHSVGIRLHRLLAYLYIPNPKGLPVINNDLSNLEWCTQQENMMHAYTVLDDYARGSECPQAKLTEEQVAVIKACIAKGERKKSLALKYKVTQTVISKINKGKSWKHVTSGDALLSESTKENYICTKCGTEVVPNDQGWVHMCHTNSHEMKVMEDVVIKNGFIEHTTTDKGDK